MATGWPMKTTYANGDVYSASDVNDITGTINLLGSSVAYTAGKNKIINGDFYFNQRNFTSNTNDNTYNFDRWVQENSGGTVTVTPQTFTAGTAPVSGYEGKNFVRVVTASQSTAGHYALYEQRIEDVRTFAGQTITVSFWAKAGSGTPNVGVTAVQSFGGGGSSAVNTSAAAVKAITTSWARYSFNISIPSISGKTIGTAVNNMLVIAIVVSTGSTLVGLGYANTGIQNNTFDIWGVQVEQGSTATAFQTATGTIQGELAACQRYYWRSSGNSAANIYGVGISATTTAANICVVNPVTMRVPPTSIDYSTLGIGDTIGYNLAVSALSISHSGITSVYLAATNATGASTARTAFLQNKDSTAGYLGLSAEL